MEMLSKIDSSHIDKIRSLYNNNKEICGLVLEDLSILPIQNISNNPNHFVFNRREWFALLNSGVGILCIYHTHLNNDPTPSTVDLACQKNIKLDFLIVTPSKWSYTPYA